MNYNITKILRFNYIPILIVLGLSISDRTDSDELPFVCPYNVEDNFGFNPGGVGLNSKGVDLEKVSKNFYKQYKAAFATVPCDATALRVFTEDQIPGKQYTVGSVFLYDKSVARLEKWLEQRYISNTYDNPIRNAVLQQCRQDILDSRFSYVKPLKGDDILKILCMQDCSQDSSTQYEKFENNIRRFVGTWTSEHGVNVELSLLSDSESTLKCVFAQDRSKEWIVRWDGVNILSLGQFRGIFDGDKTITWSNGRWVKQATEEYPAKTDDKGITTEKEIMTTEEAPEITTTEKEVITTEEAPDITTTKKDVMTTDEDNEIVTTKSDTEEFTTSPIILTTTLNTTVNQISLVVTEDTKIPQNTQALPWYAAPFVDGEYYIDVRSSSNEEKLRRMDDVTDTSKQFNSIKSSKIYPSSHDTTETGSSKLTSSANHSINGPYDQLIPSTLDTITGQEEDIKYSSNNQKKRSLFHFPPPHISPHLVHPHSITNGLGPSFTPFPPPPLHHPHLIHPHTPFGSYHAPSYPYHLPYQHTLQISPFYHPIDYPFFPVNSFSPRVNPQYYHSVNYTNSDRGVQGQNEDVVTFDNAPDPIYGFAVRTRRSFPCEENEFVAACEGLENRGDSLQCEQARFSDCDTGWNDCLEENEKNLVDNTTYYEECKFTMDVDQELIDVSSDKCFENRQCAPDPNAKGDERVFVGACDAVKVCDPEIFGENNAVEEIQREIFESSQEPPASERYKRQTGEVYKSAAQDIRVLRTRSGFRRVARDMQQIRRKRGSYRSIKRLFTRTLDVFDEDALSNIDLDIIRY